jgi:hypothetical protein
MLRTVSCATAIFALALFAVAPGSARTARAQVASHAVVGSGSYGPGCTVGGTTSDCDSRHLEFTLAAFSGPFGAGLPVFGAYERVNPANGGIFDGVVTCLKVVAGHAAVGGIGGFRASTEPPGPFLTYVTDGGLPGGIDGISELFVFGPDEQPPAVGFPFSCPAPPSPAGYFPLESGSVFIH